MCCVQEDSSDKCQLTCQCHFILQFPFNLKLAADLTLSLTVEIWGLSASVSADAEIHLISNFFDKLKKVKYLIIWK